MWYVYVLYSSSGDKSYTGYTGDMERRMYEHNVSQSKGFTSRYRPWILVYTEEFAFKSDAIQREKFFKSGRGREMIREIIKTLQDSVRYPPQAEKD